MSKSGKKPCCRKCKEVLDRTNARRSPDGKYQQLCVNCQQEKYAEYEKLFGKSLAIFYCCVANDIPFDVGSVPDDDVGDRWIEYLKTLHKNKLDKKGDQILSFTDGTIEITKIFGSDVEKGSFTKAIQNQKAGSGRLPGTANQRKNWGYDPKNPFTDDDYVELDRWFKVYTTRLESAGGYDVQQEHVLRTCSILNLRMSKALAKGDTQDAQRLNKMIQDNLSAENLRKKDEKPVEQLRIDSIVDAMEKAGMVKKGKILPLPEVQEALLRRLGALGGKPSHKYPYTLDAADQQIRIIINTMRKNDSLPEIVEYDENIMLDENVSAEFADFPSREEEEAYRDLGLVREIDPNEAQKAEGSE